MLDDDFPLSASDEATLRRWCRRHALDRTLVRAIHMPHERPSYYVSVRSQRALGKSVNLYRALRQCRSRFKDPTHRVIPLAHRMAFVLSRAWDHCPHGGDNAPNLPRTA